MDREFKSKVGLWYHFLIILLVVGSVAAVLTTNVMAMIGMLLITLLTLHIFFHTYYKVTADHMLIAHCSIFPEKKIAIADIQALESSALPVSSYALSLDRIIIWSQDKPWLLISPTNKQEFVRLLRKINPAIELRN